MAPLALRTLARAPVGALWVSADVAGTKLARAVDETENMAATANPARLRNPLRCVFVSLSILVKIVF